MQCAGGAFSGVQPGGDSTTKGGNGDVSTCGCSGDSV